MKWITRENVKVDRVACPWLIRKFVDKAAEFYFVPADRGKGLRQRLVLRRQVLASILRQKDRMGCCNARSGRQK
jgi:hypothetical protein